MLFVSPNLVIPESEIEIAGIRAGGPGGQHADKAATAVHLRFDIRASSLPTACKERLLGLDDARISADGVVIIKAREHRNREANEAAARQRLAELIAAAAAPRKPRRPTRPPRAARARRIAEKKHRGRIKSLRREPPE